MGCFKSMWFILVLALTNLAQSKKICDLDDIECTTKEANLVYKTIIKGVEDLIDPVDPVHVDKMEGQALGLKYTLSNSTMSGLRKCEVTKLKLNKEDLSFESVLRCPQLFICYCFEGKGAIDSVTFDGKGEDEITLDDYVIILKGKYETSISKKDKKPRGFVKSYVIDTEPKGKVTFKNTKLTSGSKDKSNELWAYYNKNWRTMEKLMRSPIIEEFVKAIIDKINVYLKTFPVDEIIPNK